MLCLKLKILNCFLLFSFDLFQNRNSCSSIFVERKEWMGSMSEIEGKLVCPKCLSKLGSFKWAGDQCSCGYENHKTQTNTTKTNIQTQTRTHTQHHIIQTYKHKQIFRAWQTPFIQIQKAKVDVKIKK